MKDPTIIRARPETHAMGNSLKSYIEQKVHQDLSNEVIRRVLVAGVIRRHPPAAIAAFERERMLDYRRPTTSQIGPSAVQLNCFPCQNLVIHYASLITTYLELKGRNPGIVEYLLPDPTQTADYLLMTNIQSIGDADIAIIGDIYHVQAVCKEDWQGNSASEHDIFRWKRFTTPKGETVVLLGCVEKIWGDTGYAILHAMHKQCKIQCAIYVGKAGCLTEQYIPNGFIATGNQAFVDNEVLSFQSRLDKASSTSEIVVRGPIVTVQTTLCETNEWVQQWSSKAVWVDCEVGYFARAAVELGVDFGYLHLISDNLCYSGGENLSNEELDIVITKRRRLYKEVTRIIESILL